MTLKLWNKKRVRYTLFGAAAVSLALGPSCLAHAQTRHARTPSAHPAQAGVVPAGIKNVFWQPNAIQQGSEAFFTVELEQPATRVSATWVGKSISFFKSDDPKVWHALAGVDLEAKPGSYDLSVTVTPQGGRVLRTVKKVDVAAANFKIGTVDVPENFIQPDAAGRKQIAGDAIAKSRAYAHLSPASPLWSGNFIKPVEGGSTATFGESRIFNEEKTSVHKGTDFPVKEGTPVVASNAGTVVLAKEMFYEGNCVIVDHGQKFFTIYMHLSRMDVAAGDKLDKGGKIGLSGATGRVTGPHLHMGVRWNGAYLDPVQLLALTLPKTEAPAEDAKPPVAHTARPRGK